MPNAECYVGCVIAKLLVKMHHLFDVSGTLYLGTFIMEIIRTQGGRFCALYIQLV